MYIDPATDLSSPMQFVNTHLLIEISSLSPIVWISIVAPPSVRVMFSKWQLSTINSELS